MKKDLHDKFRCFLLRHNLTISQIQELVLEYANSESSFARSHFTKKYEISEHVFYKCRDYAISCHLVDDIVCNRLKQKASENYCLHNPKSNSKASINHFVELMNQRKAFLLSFANIDICAMAEMYAYGMCADQIAHEYKTGKSAINKLLLKGITELIIDNDLIQKIIKVMPASKLQIDCMLHSRTATKNHILYMQSLEIKVLEYKISNYEVYFVADSKKPTLEDLKNELTIAKQRHEKTVAL